MGAGAERRHTCLSRKKITLREAAFGDPVTSSLAMTWMRGRGDASKGVPRGGQGAKPHPSAVR